MKRTITALLLAGILAGCGGAAAAVPSAAASATPTAPVALTPTPFKPVALPGCGCGGSTPGAPPMESIVLRGMAPTLLGEGFRIAP